MAKIVSGPDLFAFPIAFQNNSAGLRKVYWLDTNGERQPYCELKAGENCGLGILEHSNVRVSFPNEVRLRI